MAKKIIIGLVCTFLWGAWAYAREPLSFDDFYTWHDRLYHQRPRMIDIHTKLGNFMRSNISKETFLPLSFAIPKVQKEKVYGRMGVDNSVRDIIERIIVEEGLCIYDGAVSQIALTMLGGDHNMVLATVPLEIYWEGGINDLYNIRAGYPINTFIYDPDDPGAVSSDLSQKGQRGFIYRIINAHGRYNTQDPLDGKEHFAGFPNWPTVHWEDWKPVAGENAWVVMAAMHVYHKKYYDPYRQRYHHPKASIELQLAEEIARAALILQADNGGIRMAPLGTFRNAADCANKEERNGAWWYRQISSENNLSWYAALRMLYAVTHKPVYKEAMEGIVGYFKQVFNQEGGYFYQGMHYINGHWEPNDAHYALDVQTWGIDVFGPQRIDSWFGQGTAYRIWVKAKATSGCYDKAGRLLGVGFIRENDRLSVEWTAGAIFAARLVAAHYKHTHPQWGLEALKDVINMRQGIEDLLTNLSRSKAAYSYSSRRGWIPFGWFSHDPQVLSLTSSGWVLFVDYQFNPFLLPSSQNQLLSLSQ